MRDRLRPGRGIGKQQMPQTDIEQAFDRPELAPPQIADLLDQVRPVDGIVHPLAGGEAAEQRGLLLGPEEEIRVVEAAMPER